MMKTVSADSGGRRPALGLVLCVVVLVTGLVSARAAAVTIQETTIALEPGEVRTVHAQTSWGLPFRDALSWTIVPTWLGTVDDRGFHAGELSGSGTLIARFGPAAAVIPVTVTCPKLALMAQGVPEFDYTAFGKRLSDRVAALLPAYPGITVAAGSPDGTGSTVIAYGLTPNAAATVATAGPLVRLATGRVDPYGIYVKYVGADWPAGEYRVTIESEGRQFEVIATR